jgi:ribosomal protein S6E (S10)
MVSILISVITGCYVQDKGFGKIVAATIEERLRLYSSKTRCFCPRKNGDRPHFVRKRTFSA